MFGGFGSTFLFVFILSQEYEHVCGLRIRIPGHFSLDIFQIFTKLAFSIKLHTMLKKNKLFILHFMASQVIFPGLSLVYLGAGNS